MEYVTNELINLFNFLLPGFITSFLFYSLTSFPKKSEFESVVMALIYTIVINSLIEVLGWAFLALGETGFSIGEWASTAKVLWSVFFALLFGFLLTFLYNNDLLHSLLRKLKITSQTSYPTEWFGTFSETHLYIILHFTDGRRIMGWPLRWPSSPKNGHFILEDAVWLETEEKPEKIKLTNTVKIMLDTANINAVEFLKQSEVKNECPTTTTIG
jgi:hypothetical protein